ncbi:NADH:flavin oxidoreductase/NADH oxidase [Acetobacter fallax]|uniref:Oxidoreductase n=1 Tax=Acetobacter fallax TaxID=1737473 RepID=A0ABX0K9Q3_9PROT|nr:NADH:flavin oxidoreductase/NADH oxidase [Acetobacter fallax]NHO31706.1 oxidoreductase [Acetobacter fallax]NHO35265.1 oxidoreductase [Acetobacter fallax]
MSGPKLFEPKQIGTLPLANRIIIAPMCQYSAIDGCMTDWHLIHLGNLALSGAGILTIEATAVTSEGRITAHDVGLWDDTTEAAMARALKGIRTASDIPVAIQLGHAGRKASVAVPWKGGKHIPPGAPEGWQTEAPSAIPFTEGTNPPHALDKADLASLRNAYGTAAKRAARLGINAIQLHAAHGYLIHQFLSPLSNQRTDDYGGSLENRLRFPLEVFDTIREAFPEGPVTIRISGTDWVPGGWDIDQSIALAKALETRGCDAIHVSSGGLSPQQQIPVGPSYQVPLARAVKAETDIPVIAVGLITGFEQAEAIVSTGDADFIALARTILYDPRWPWHAAAHLGAQIKAPNQYLRCQPHTLKELFLPPN